MKKWIKRIGATLVITMIVLYIGACNYVEYQLRNLDDRGLPRATMSTETKWTVSYLSGGNAGKPRLIYVHGTPGNATNFTRYLTDPVDDRESISIDRPGFGRTTPNDPTASLAEQAKVIEPFLVRRDGQWPILIGHSLGGPIIARVATDFPDKVAGLVILAGSMDPDLERVWWIQRIADFAFMPYLIPGVLRNSNTEVLPLAEELRALEPLLANIGCPIYVVHSHDDSLVPYENVAYMENAFPVNSIKDVIELTNKDHFIPWNSEPVIRETIKAAIQSVSDS